jgi:methanogenic corrinoid protein MtbC1
MASVLLKSLTEAILAYDKGKAEEIARKTIDEGIDPLETVDAMTKAVREVGEGFAREELWLPDLVGAGAAMQGAMSIVEEEIKSQGKVRSKIGTVVIGTVKGDIHNIGKNMVGALLTASGFEVIDLDVDVSAERFVDAVMDFKPNIMAMSALMTMTAPEQGKVIRALEEADVRDKIRIMVGGGAITQDFANQIGADGFASTAPGAVKLALSMVEAK